MSCSCCCNVTPSGELLEGIRKKERLVREEEEEEGAGGGEEEEIRRNMDISLLREQYRCTRETQKRHTQVLLFRTVSEELSEAVGIIPVTQGLTSSWEPNSSSPPAITFDPDPATYDPWHVHLGLHRRSCPGVTRQLSAPSPETTNTNSSSRRSSSSSEAVGSQQEVDLTSDPPCSSFNSTREEDHFNTDRSRGDPHTGSSDRSRGDSFSCCQTDPVQVSVSGDSVLQSGSTSAWRGSRKFSAPALRFTTQQSIGGLGSSTGVHHNQNYHPFPNRKTPRISEAARRLGMYSSF